MPDDGQRKLLFTGEPTPMPTDDLEPLDRFHRELKSVSASGTVVDIGLGPRQAGLTEELDRIRAMLVIRVGLGQSLDAAVREEASLPPRYRAAALAWLRFDSPAEVLDALVVDSARHDGVLRGLRISLLQSGVLLAIVCVCLAVSAIWLSPRIDAIYEDLQMKPTESAIWLSAARAWLPVWTTAASVAFLAILWLALYSHRTQLGRLSEWLPMVRRRQRLIGQARFAQYLSSWLRQDLPADEGTALAASFSGLDLAPDRPAVSPEEVPRPDLPPLVNWALTGDLAGESRSSTLQTVAEVYRRLADRQIAWWARTIPVDFATVIGGIAVLLYGLSVLLPILGLLQDVASFGRE
ncbi:MAG: hypothetical protein EA381_08470 [Planctomycetaceae bacterium]|nr:MAG: hypothetical protein EA381_08470 [Planctomycetaceae bacterium]